MKRKNNIVMILLLSSIFALASCGEVVSKDSISKSSISKSEETTSGDSQNVPSSNSSSSNPLPIADGTVTFSEVLSLLNTFSDYETTNSSSAKIEKHSTCNDSDTVSTEEYSILPDGSGASQGKVEVLQQEAISQSDTFKRRVVKQNDKIMVDGTTTTYPMYYSITDYAKNSMKSNAYSDSADMRYVIGSEKEKGDLQAD